MTTVRQPSDITACLQQPSDITAGLQPCNIKPRKGPGRPRIIRQKPVVVIQGVNHNPIDSSN